MTKISTDNNFIFSLLDKTNALPIRFDLDDVIAFDFEDTFYIIIYLSSCRNFISFSVSDFIQDSNRLIYMQQVVESYSEKKISPELIDKALELIEHKLLTKDNESYFFDAH